MKHFLPPGCYVVDPSTCVVIAGPFKNAREARASTGGETCPCCVLEVTGGPVRWSPGQTTAAPLPPYLLSYKERASLVNACFDGGLRQSELAPDAEECTDDTSAAP